VLSRIFYFSLTYNKIDAIIRVAQADHKMSLRFAPRYVSAYLFFYIHKEKAGVRLPQRTSLCLCFGFHRNYYSIAIIQLIAKLAHKMSSFLHLPPQRFPL